VEQELLPLLERLSSPQVLSTSCECRQHNDQRKKDKQRSFKHYTEILGSSNMNPTHNWCSKPVVNSVAPENVDIIFSGMVCFWNKFHQVGKQIKDWKAK
jgi:hypothetical protein